MISMNAIKAANAKVKAPAVRANKVVASEATPFSVRAAVVVGAAPAHVVHGTKTFIAGTKTFAQNVAESYKYHNRELNS
jgi:hypothetical protein